MCETESVRSFLLYRARLSSIFHRLLRARRPAVRSRGLVELARHRRSPDQFRRHVRSLRGTLESARCRPHLLESVDRGDLGRSAAAANRRALAGHRARLVARRRAHRLPFRPGRKASNLDTPHGFRRRSADHPPGRIRRSASRGRRMANRSPSPHVSAEPPPPAAWAPAAILPLLRRPAARVQLFVIPATGGHRARASPRRSRSAWRTCVDAGRPVDSVLRRPAARRRTPARWRGNLRRAHRRWRAPPDHTACRVPMKRPCPRPMAVASPGLRANPPRRATSPPSSTWPIPMAAAPRCWPARSIATCPTCNGATIRVPSTSWPTIAAPPASTPRATMARCVP